MSKRRPDRRVNLKPSVLAAAVSLAVATLAVTPAFATSTTIDGTVPYTSFSMTGTDTLLITAPGVGTAAGGSVNHSGTGTAVTISGETGSGVALTNNGTIGAAANYTDTGMNVVARGVGAGSGLAGNITSNGTISVSSSNANGYLDGWNSYATAYGIDVAGAVNGSIVNGSNGNITVSVSASSGWTTANAVAYGVNAGSVGSTGSISNSGTIAASANAQSDTNVTAKAYGVNVGGAMAGTLTNGGTISASATAHSAYGANASAYGVNVAGLLSGTITNNGTISATASVSNASGGNAHAYGVNLGAGISNTGSLTNNGTINVSATASANNSDNAYAYGVNMHTHSTAGGYSSIEAGGAFTNNGAINVTASATSATSDAYGYAAGAYLDGALNGSFTNTASGSFTVTASANGNYADATATGVAINSGIGATGSFRNAGHISATSTATSNSTEAYAYAYGVYVNGSIAQGATFSNTGTINAVANATAATYAYASGYGASVNGTLDGSFTNGGTISASLTANGTRAEISNAYGLYLNDGITGTGSLTNSGTISVTANVTATNSYADVYRGTYGLYVGGHYATSSSPYNSIDQGGTLTNSGTISATATATAPNGDAEAYEVYGVYLDGYLNGTFTNTANGTISASATANGYYADASAVGVYLNYGIGATGVFSNAGHITATASATANSDDAYAYAYGVYMDDPILQGGSFTNTGTISATATANVSNYYAEAEAYGVYQWGTLGGTLTNGGTISATATANGTYAEAYAYGMYLENGIGATGSLSNSGSITAVGTATATSSTAYAYDFSGLYVGGHYATSSSTYNAIDQGGTLTNSGTISATATATAPNGDAEAYDVYGVYLDGYLNGTFTNTANGTISASATANGYYADASAIGVYLSYGIGATGVFSNAGHITATATATSNTTEAYADAYGVYMDDPILQGGSFTNSGTISATATANGPSYAWASAYGVYHYGTLDGTFSNSGTISATATGNGTYGGASAYGVYISGDVSANGSLTNTGTIIATANAQNGSAYAYGVYVNGSLDGTLTNSGSITGVATNPANGYSLYIDGGSGNVYNQQGGLLSGNLYVAGAVNVYNSGTISIPEAANNSAAAYIGGNYTQTSTGVFKIGASSDTSYGQLVVGGTANIAGTAYVNVANVNTLAKGQVLLGVVAANSLTGNFSSVGDNSALVNFTSVIDSVNPNQIDFNVVAASTVLQAVNNNGNTPGTGAAVVLDNLNTAGGTGAMAPVITALNQMGSQQQVSNAVSQTLPLLTASSTVAVQDSLHNVSRIINARQEGNLGLSSGDEFLGDKSFWFKPFGSWANQDNRNGASGYSANTAGLVFGADGVLDEANRIGLAFAYTHSNLDSNSDVAPNSARVDNYQLIGYGSHSLDDRTEINYQADFGEHTTKGNRDIIFMSTVARSNYDGWSAHAGVGLGRSFDIDSQTTFTPSVRADYTWIRDNAYNESGAGVLDLNVNRNTSHELILGVDGKVAHKLTDNIALVANLGGGYDVLSTRNAITSAYAGDATASFITTGIEQSRWLGRGGLGLTGTTENGVEISARYDFEVRSGFDNQTASVKVKVPF